MILIDWPCAARPPMAGCWGGTPGRGTPAGSALRFCRPVWACNPAGGGGCCSGPGVCGMPAWGCMPGWFATYLAVLCFIKAAMSCGFDFRIFSTCCCCCGELGDFKVRSNSCKAFGGIVRAGGCTPGILGPVTACWPGMGRTGLGIPGCCGGTGADDCHCPGCRLGNIGPLAELGRGTFMPTCCMGFTVPTAVLTIPVRPGGKPLLLTR